MNPVYVLETISANENRYHSAQLGREVILEPQLLRPFLGGPQMRRYEIVPTTSVVLIPYEQVGPQHGQLVPAEILREQLPSTWRYLKSCEEVLRGRENGRMDTDEWYGFIYPKNLGLIDVPKILVPDIVEAPSFAVDPRGGTAFVSGYAITLSSNHRTELYLLAGLLNSRLLGSFLKDISTPLRGGWYRPFPQFLAKLPIKLPASPEEKKLAARIVESVQAIMDRKTKLRDGQLSDRQRASFESEIEHHERRIDEAVFRLYGVENAPIAG